MASGHNVKPTSWVTVVLIIVASILLGFALPLHSLPLAIGGGVLLLLGFVTGGVFHIMEDAH
jgi:hypothetical protein